MDDTLQLLTVILNLPVAAMVMARISGLIAFAPFFGSGSFPIKARALLTAALTLIVVPFVGANVAIPSDLGQLVAAMTAELFIGLFFGFVLTVMFASLQLAGQLIGQQMGLAMAQAFDPLFEQQTTIMSQLYFWLGMIIFLLINGHQELLAAIINSFGTVPVGSFTVTGEMISVLGGVLQTAYAVAFQVAAPILLTMFLTSLALGFVARTVPQLNILSVGFPLRVMLGFIIAIVCLVAGINVFLASFEDVFDRVAMMLN